MQKRAQIIFTTCLALLVQQSCVDGTISRRCKDYIRYKACMQALKSTNYNNTISLHAE